MRILHVFKTYWPDSFGGIERTIHAIAKGAVEYGVHSDVLSLSKAPGPAAVEFDGHMVHKSKLNFEIASTGFSRDVFSKFRELHRSADTVHYHFPWPVGDMLHLTGPDGKPSIVTYHSDIVKQRFLLKLYSPLMHRFLGSVDKIVATSPNYLATSHILQQYSAKTTVIPLGLNEDDYPPASKDTLAYWRHRLPKKFFLFVGVLRYYKGIDVLIEAATRTHIPIVIVGKGPYEDLLRSNIAKHRLSNVFFLGALPDVDKAALLELCTALVFPSNLRSEAFGLSLVEAAMFSKPMISCEIGTGTSFVNRNEVTGLVVKPNDPDALSAAMKKILESKTKAVEMGLTARRLYLELFTADKMVKSYVELYKQLTGLNRLL